MTVDSDARTRRQAREAVFRHIQRTNGWGNGESVSGPGSTRERAQAVREDLVALVANFGIRVLLDAPCGDFNWMKEVDLSVERYVGIDIVSDLIAANEKAHGRPGRSFRVADLVADPLPRADLVLCRDALVHFPHAEIRAALANFRRSGSTWLLMTHFVGPRPNDEIVLGDWRPLNFELPPFELPEPAAQIDERLGGEAAQWSDKRLALWRLEDLAEWERRSNRVF
jgi:hypothetical protein